MINAVLLFLNIGTPELILIMFVVLMLFGGDKLPGLARGLGKGIRDFKDASEGVKREINNQIYNYDDKKAAALEEPEPEENDEPDETEKTTEDKPLLDYTPIEGTVPLSGYPSYTEEEEKPEEETQQAHTDNTTGSNKPAN